MLPMNLRYNKQVHGRRPLNKNEQPMSTPGVDIGSGSGQVFIETTLAFVAIVIFLLGITQIFLWMNRSIIERQKAYQASRTSLGSPGSMDFYDTRSAANRLYVFPEERP